MGKREELGKCSISDHFTSGQRQTVCNEDNMNLPKLSQNACFQTHIRFGVIFLIGPRDQLWVGKILKNKTALSPLPPPHTHTHTALPRSPRHFFSISWQEIALGLLPNK